MPVHTLLGSDPLSVRAKALVYEDARSRVLLERIQQVAPSDATVLIYGETGTGKEIVARHVHALSRRTERAFVAINCGALSATLVESELFGHERGAFTGASSAKAGWFEEADGGTLFLDEIGDLPIAMQVKLLRILQEGEVVRLGSRTPLPVNVRLIAASNVRLEEAVLAGRFREDLYSKLDYQDIRLVDASPERALAMFESGLVDAWATWDPFLGSAQRAAPVRTLRDARGLTGNTSYYIATRAFAEQRRELVQQFLHEVNATARWASQNGPAALELLASQGSPQLDATTLGGGIGAWPIDAGHLASQQAVADTFLRLNLIARPVEVADASWRAPSPNPPTSPIYA
jgi:hypothetical protein